MSAKNGLEVPACSCGAREGEFHESGCGFEICPFCGSTASAGCECIYDHLGLRRRRFPAENHYLSREAFERGATPEQQLEWEARCASRGRLPYVYAPQMCGRCGALWPDFFMVQDAAWEYYAGPSLRAAIVCEPCFSVLRASVDEHQPRPAWVPTPTQIQAYVQAWRAGDRDGMKRLDPKKFEPGPPRNLRFP